MSQKSITRHTLQLGGECSLDPMLQPGSIVEFRSDYVNTTADPSHPKVDNVAINFVSDHGDTLLHISFRRRENKIAFCTKRVNGPWIGDKRVPLDGVFDRQDAVISVEDLEGLFKQENITSNDPPAYHLNDGTKTSILANDLAVTVRVPGPPRNFTSGYFRLTPASVAKESEDDPFDIVIVGTGIGGGVLASDLLQKNRRLTGQESYFTDQSTSPDAPKQRFHYAPITEEDKSLRILVVEQGGLIFHTHCLNGPRPTSRGTYGQMNDAFYNTFKDQFEMDEATAKIWKGGPVFCLGGRSTVWGLFSPRINTDTFETRFPPAIHKDLNETYLQQAEEMMRISYPETLPVHQALIDKLNVRSRSSTLPTTQWQWGRVASEFRDPKNFDFAQGAYSTVDRLVEAAMNDPNGDGKFKTLINAPVVRLEPKPHAGRTTPATHVVVKDGSNEYKIKGKKFVLSAGAVESPAILLRSAREDTLETAFGQDFVDNFGHVTDHYIFAVSMPFFYRNMANKDLIGAVKLQTDIQFDIDKSVALANISLDASSFLPRRAVPDSDLPQFILAYILPSDLAPRNNIQLGKDGEPKIKVEYAKDPNLGDKKKVLEEFSVDVMNKISDVLDVQFVKRTNEGYIPLSTVSAEDITIGELGPGGVAHELGSLPMPDKEGTDGVLDADLKMKYGWDNVHVCDLSVFPYSPAANPTLTLAALSLRLSDKLVQDSNYQPIVVYNLTTKTVYVKMTLSDDRAPSFGPVTLTKIENGKSCSWKRSQREVIFIYDCPCEGNFEVQMVYPGVNAMIVRSPPAAANCSCK